MPGSPPSTSHYSFVYHELWTADPEGRIGFYRDLFGWDIVRETREDGEFLRIRHGDQELARIVPLDDESGPDRWNAFLAVPDLAALLVRVEAAGGEVLIRAQVLPGLGKAALVMDPLGGVFAALAAGEVATEMTGGSRAGTAGGTGAPHAGHFVWHDLLTPDLEGASRFYQSCLGVVATPLSAETAHAHRQLQADGRDLAGILATNDPEHAALWLPYIAVEDVDATVARATAAQAHLWLEPTEVEGLGIFAVLSDPGRAIFAVRGGAGS